MDESVPGEPARLAPQQPADPVDRRAGDDGPRLPSDAGEPACLLHLVCDACGALATERERDAQRCPRCDAPLAG
ncbi:MULTISPECIES: hypothetical protein [unclassified Streptomyces]|uniref:hypothetical protein n=1 Tax=unclassified Streptomyces TaxID=2593676 RepID=UPI0004BD6367|nr:MULTISPECIES: hypothetical protein [unclassified Streptomyces]